MKLGSGAFSIRAVNSLHTRVTLPALSSSSAWKQQQVGVPARASSSHGSHVELWTAEKVLSGALIPIIPLAFMFPCGIMDYLLAFSLTVHGHWGIDAIVVDYIRPSIFGEVIPKISIALVYALSFVTLGGLCYFTYSDVGLVNAVKMLWKL